MEKAAKVLVPPQTDKVSLNSDADEVAAAAAAAASPPNAFEAMEAFGRRLEDIIRTHGSASVLMDKQDAEMEKTKEEPKGGAKAAAAAASALQQKVAALLEERRSSIAARCKLETLCKELQAHYNMLREETLQRCKDEEEKRSEITSHFQSMLKEIQAQIEQHSARNDKLCRENANLTDKLESLMSQCETREESLEKINKHRDLQHKLTEAKLQQANALLTEAEEKHKREKEYLLREAIDKTKKCFTMKEQELAMKKKLTLYAQKFDEFQETLAKSNEIYIRFKKDMDNMSEKMKKVEKESNVWKARFENCNKALTDMIEERSEKGKEYELFVLKIQKLEKLCRALQEERKGLYGKIKEVRLSNSSIQSKFLSSTLAENLDSGAADDDKCALLTPKEIQEIQEGDEVLTEDMSRLRSEQAKLQEFAESLLASPFDDEDEEVDLVDDVVASAFIQFTSKAKQEVDLVPEVVQKEPGSLPEASTTETSHAEPKPEELQTVAEVREVQPVQPVEEIQSSPSIPTPEPKQNRSTEPLPTPALQPPTNQQAAEKVVEETGEVKPLENQKPQQQQIKETPQVPPVPAPPTESTPVPAPPTEKTPVPVLAPPTESMPPPVPAPPTESTPTPILAPPTESTPAPVPAPPTPISAPPTETTPTAAAATSSSSNHDSSRKQAPKKKKKRNVKSAS
ncbi:unnamed protein product [Ophioblennius macclurei]